MSNGKEVIESTSKQIDSHLDALQSKIDTLNHQDNFYSYEKKENGVFQAKVNGVKLEVDFYNSKDLLVALQLIAHMISVYTKAWHNTPFYAGEDSWTKWDRESIIDLKVDNRVIFDTTFLRAETIKKVFWINDTRNKMETQKIADFLNQVLWVGQKKEEN